MRLLLFCVLLLPGLLFAAADPHSYAEPDQVKVSHLSLDLDVDFAARRLRGHATMQLQRVVDRPRRLALDTRDLLIDKAEVRSTADRPWRRVRHRLEPLQAVLGQRLLIPIDADTSEVRVHYRTQPRASALQWLNAQQTAGKRHPFLFTQSQAIHARTWVPIQDTPAVRFTYDATIRVPKGLRVLMSAINDPEAPTDGEFRFEMPQAIPSYLLALAVGDLGFRAIGPRSGVYAEPELLDRAHHEFGETEDMMVAAEALYGPYRWGRYDLLVLPPSFPFGGMENPRLSFITPTVLAGDRSLTSLIAHELAHSWSGNLVTNARWQDLWLNEGFTNFFEARIVERIYGAERMDMEFALSAKSLLEEFVDLPTGDQHLMPDFRKRDPDDVFSGVPYVKGQWFLRFLDARFGRDAFDRFLRTWFDEHAFQSVTTEQFETYLQRELMDRYPGKVSMAEVQAWIHGPGIPPTAPDASSSRFDALQGLLDGWQDGSKSGADLLAANWETQETLYFLNGLIEPQTPERLAELDRSLNLTGSANTEIAHAWYRLALRNEHFDAIAAELADYLREIGRRKLVVPLYQDLAKTETGLRFAREVYAQARPGYHPITQVTVDAALKSD